MFLIPRTRLLHRRYSSGCTSVLHFVEVCIKTMPSQPGNAKTEAMTEENSMVSIIILHMHTQA